MKAEASFLVTAVARKRTLPSLAGKTFVYSTNHERKRLDLVLRAMRYKNDQSLRR